MNYYKFHIGDHTRSCADLSMLEDGAYRRLLDAYYRREKPLPGDLSECYRLARARTSAERKSVENVIGRFFTLKKRGYSQRRAEAELAQYKHKKTKARDAANERWRQENANADAMRTQCTGDAIQEPITNSKNKSKTKTDMAAAPPFDEPWFEEFKAAYPRRAGDEGWPEAARAARARMRQGHRPEEFIEGAKRYAVFVRATQAEGTRYVKAAANFLGPDKKFLGLWPLPATKADSRLAGNLAAADEFMRRTQGQP